MTAKPDPSQAPTPSPVTAAPSPAKSRLPDVSELKSYSPPDGTFTVLFPSVPTVTPTPPNALLGKTGGATYMVDLDAIAFLVTHSRFTKGQGADAKAELDAAKNSVIQSLPGKLTREKDVTVSGHPGREMVIDVPSEGMVMRVLLVIADKDVFQLMAGVRPGEESSAVADKFIASFELKNKAAPAEPVPEPEPKEVKKAK